MFLITRSELILDLKLNKVLFSIPWILRRNRWRQRRTDVEFQGKRSQTITNSRSQHS